MNPILIAMAAIIAVLGFGFFSTAINYQINPKIDRPSAALGLILVALSALLFKSALT